MSLFYKLESLLCCTQFLNWRPCALWALRTPAVGAALGLDWKELKVMAFVLLAWHPSPTAAERKMDSTVKAAGPAGLPEQAVQASQACCIRLPERDPARSGPSPPGRRESSFNAANRVQNRQLCSSLASLAHPQISAPFPSCFLPGRGAAAGVWEPVSPSSLELALFTSAWALVLSSGPSPPKCAYC